MNSVDSKCEGSLKPLDRAHTRTKVSHAEPIEEKEIAAMQNFIENALQTRLQGNPTQFNYLLQHLVVMIPSEQTDDRFVTGSQQSKDDVSLVVCRKILLALTRCISRLTREAEVLQPLFDTLFKFSYYALHEGEESSASLETIATISAYTSFLLNLVSSQSVFVIPTLHMLVRNLARPKNLESADSDELVSSRSEYVHKALQRVLTIIPTSTNVLSSILSQTFPHKRMAAIVQVTYVRNLMKIASYAPALEEQIIALTVDRLVQIDVEIKLDEKDLDAAEETMFTMDDFLDENLAVGDVEDIDEMADKLDKMMLVMFEYLEEASGQLRNECVPCEAAHVFRSLLRAFELSILNTHRSKYPQFLLFYLCQYHAKYQNAFISHLITASIDPKIPPVTRQSCGAYLASFLARAKYVSTTYLEKALYHLLRYLHDQVDIYERSYPNGHDRSSVDDGFGIDRAANDRPSISQFHKAIFISTLQTVCYVVCFRGLEMVNAPKSYDFLRSLGWERLFETISPCPLVFCQQSVTLEFLNVAELFQLISPECAERIDQSISSFGSSLQKASAVNDSIQNISHTICTSNWKLPHTFFPFDPYLLRRSFKYISSLYLYWKHADPTSHENAKNLEHTKHIIDEYEDQTHDDGETTDGEIDASSVCSVESCADKDFEQSSEMQERRLSIGAQQDIDFMDSDVCEFQDATYVLAAKQMQRKRGKAMFVEFSPDTRSFGIAESPMKGESTDFYLDGYDEEMEGF